MFVFQGPSSLRMEARYALRVADRGGRTELRSLVQYLPNAGC